MTDSKWFCRFAGGSSPTPIARLFCLPPAGAGATTYAPWPKAVRAGIEVLAVQPPGRESRIAERPYQSMRELVEALIVAIEPLLDRPYVIFGHSMGARVGFELAHRILAGGLPPPRHLFASATSAPQDSIGRPPISHLPRDEFLTSLRDYQGTPEELLQNEQLIELLLPALRADFRLVETYRSAVDRDRLPTPTSVFHGREDSMVNVDDLRRWAEVANVVQTVAFDGGHFYIREQYENVLGRIVATLAATMH